jgi:RNA polymerase sigma-70 factor (ECF subfamily)
VAAFGSEHEIPIAKPTKEGYAMGRHAAKRPAPEYDGRHPTRSLLHADLFAQREPEGDEERIAVFDALVTPHYASLRVYVMRLTEGDEAAADSVLKETMYRAEQDPSRYPQRDSAVRPWLVLIARTVLRDGERHEPAGHDDRPESIRRRPIATGPVPPTTVIRALDELSGVHREVLVELFYRGVSLEEAARVRDSPVETVKSRLYYAMRALRAVLDRQLAERHETP